MAKVRSVPGVPGWAGVGVAVAGVFMVKASGELIGSRWLQKGSWESPGESFGVFWKKTGAVFFAPPPAQNTHTVFASPSR